MCRLSEESNSDAGTEFIDWLELMRAVDKEQSLACKLHLPLSFSFSAAAISGKASLESFSFNVNLIDLSKNCLFHLRIGTTTKIWYVLRNYHISTCW